MQNYLRAFIQIIIRWNRDEDAGRKINICNATFNEISQIERKL